MEPATKVDIVNYGLDIIVRYDKTVMCYFMSRHETSKFFYIILKLKDTI